jgi:hypothetical protein
VLPPATILCDLAHELARVVPPGGKDLRVLEWDDIDLERWVSTNSVTLERTTVLSEAGCSNSHYTTVHFYRLVLVIDKGSVKHYLTTDGWSVIVITCTIPLCVGKHMVLVSLWVGKKD